MAAYRKPYWKCLVKYSAHLVAYFFFYLLNNAMYRRDFGRFKVGEQVSIIFSIHRFFLRSSRYFSSIVISINFYHVECGDGRQPRILVDNFWIPRSKTRMFSTPAFLTKAVLLLFFASVRAFAFFQGQNNFISTVLWIFTSNISPHFAEFAGMKLKIISAR